MSRRIEIELTSALDDGTFTWRAAGAKQPKGVVPTVVLPDGARVGDQFKVEVEQTIDGIDITSVVQGRQRVEKAESLELLPSEKEFKPIVETRAPGGRRRDGDGKGRRRRRDDDSGDRGGRRDRSRNDRGRDRGDDDRGRNDRGRGGRNDRGPRHAPPPEVPTRPKPKRLKPGKARRNEVLAQLPEEQRPIAELTLQGMPAVRQRLKEENEKAAAEGRPTMPEASVMQMAESLLPKLRVAEWLDRAEAAQRQLATLDLRDLRSVVAAASDPAVARDESTRSIAAELKEALAAKQEEELVLWYGDIDASLAVGRVIRALRLSAQPPKAGVPFPVDIAERLTTSTNAALTPVERPDRWVATLEAAAFSPIHTQVVPMGRPEQVTDELVATITRLGPALPRVAEAFGIEVDPEAPMPKPLRPDYGKRRKERDEAKGGSRRDRDKPRSDDNPRGGAKRSRGDSSRTDGDGSEKPDAPAASPDAGDEAPASAEHTQSDQTADPSPADASPQESETPVAVQGESDSASDSDAAVPVGDVIDGVTPDEALEADEAEMVAEAAVVAEAEALTEAATEVAAGASETGTPERSDPDQLDMVAITQTATEILEAESERQADAVDDGVRNYDAGASTADTPSDGSDDGKVVDGTSADDGSDTPSE